MHADNRLQQRDYASVLEVRDYMHSAWASKWLILSLGIVGLAAAAVWLKFYPPEYVAKAVIRFIPPKVSERYVSTSGDSWAEQRTAALSQSMSSSLTARKMVEGAKLYPEMRRFVTSADLVPRFQEALTIKSVAWKGAPGARPVASIEINFRYSNPEVAKQVVQQMVETVYETNERYRGDQSLGTAQFLTEQTEAARLRLEEMEDDIGALQRPDRIAGDHEWALKIQNLYGTENRLGHVQASLRTIRRDLGDKLTEIDAVEQEIRRIPQVFTAQSEGLTIEGVRLKADLNEAEVRVQVLKKRYTPTHPDMGEAVKQLEGLQAQMEAQQLRDVDAARARAKRQAQTKLDLLRSDRDAMYTTIRGLETEEAALTRKAAELRADAYSTREEDSNYLRVMREYSALSDHYKALHRKERDAEIASEVDRQGQGEMVELLDPPTVPTKPEFPNAPMKLGTGTVGGLMLGVFLSFLRLQMRPTLRTAYHLGYWQGAVLLADLPAGRLGEPAIGLGGRLSRLRPRLTGPTGLLLLLVLSAIVTTGCATNPERAKANWFKAAAAASRNGDVHRAIVCYRAVIRLDLRNGKAHEQLAAALLSIGEVEEALGHLIRAAELAPSNPRIQTDLTQLLYRVYYSDPGRSRATLMELEEQARLLLTRWPGQADGYRAMAAVLCERSRTGEACDLVQQGLEKTQQDPALVVELASLRYRLGQRAEAEALLRKLTDEGCKLGQAYDLLYLQLRDRNQAKSAGEVLRRKWAVLGDADSGIQLAAHLESVGERAAMINQVEDVANRLGGQAGTLELIGAFWASRGEHEMARRQYEIGASRFPSHRSGFIGKLAELEVAAGKRGDALARIKSAIEKWPRDTTLLAYKAALELDSPTQTEEKSAQLDLEMLMKRMPKSAFVRFHLGRSYLKIGDLYRAGKEFARCIRLDPNYAPGWLALAESEYRAGHIALSKSTLDSLLQRAPRYAGALLLRARVLQDLGNVKETMQTLEQAATAGAPVGEVAAERARLRMRGGDLAGAERLLEEAIGKSGPEPALMIAMARVEEARGDGEKAMARLKQAASVNPNSREIEAARAATLSRMKRHEEAAGIYQRLVVMTPQSPEYSSGLADSLALSGKLQEALAEYRRAQTLPGASASIWVKTAAVHNALGDTNAAREAYEAALSRDGGNPFALNNLAYLLGRRGERMDYALQLAQNAGQIMPDSLEVQDTLIYVTLRMGLKQQAMEILDRAAARSKPPSKAWFQSLRAQLGKGTPEEVLRRMEAERRERRDS